MMNEAIELLELGFRPIPLHKGSKKSRIPWKEFQKRPPTEDEVRRWWEDAPDANVAIVMGSGAVVVDADSPEAVAWIEAHLPRTPWRVKTARGYHYYYRTKESVPSVSNRELKIDLQSTGKYVVAPPSVHESGTVYRWDRDGGTESWELSDLPVLTLSDVLRVQKGLEKGKTFSGSIFDLRDVELPLNHPITETVEEGGRNNAAASIVGQLIHQGLRAHEIRSRVFEWNASNPDPLDDVELSKVVSSIVGTHERKTGEMLVKPMVSDVGAVRIASRESGEDVARFKAMRPPGILGEVFDYYQASAPHPNELLATQAALALGSVVLGRRYTTTERNFASLYLVSIAKSTTGKEHGRTVINAILNASGTGDLMSGSGYTSPGAVYSELKERPNHIAVIDEFGKYLEATQATGNFQLKEAVTVLVEAFGVLHSSLRPKSYSEMSGQAREKVVIDRPAITLLGLTTPNQFYDALGSGDVETGVLGRLLVIESKAPRRKRQKIRVDVTPPGRVIAWVKEARDDGGMHEVGELVSSEMAPDPVVVAFDEEAERVIDQFEDEVLRRQDELEAKRLDVILGRSVELAMRISLILALSVDVRRPLITGELARWAVSYVRQAAESLVSSVSSRMTESGYASLRGRVLEAVLAAGPRGLTEYEVGRALKSIEPRRRGEILRDLRESREIDFVRMEGAGRRREAWVALEDVT